MHLAEQESRLNPLHNRAASIWLSLYAVDAKVFTNPDKNEVDTLKELFDVFGLASGLQINLRVLCSRSTMMKSTCKKFYPVCNVISRLFLENTWASLLV